LSYIDFDNCGKLLLMMKEHKKTCACTASHGNESFNYACAKMFNTSYSGSLIRAQLEDLNGNTVKEYTLKLPLISRLE
ncbi:hypothetical protein BgiBS90_019386, partial [Biomphalaria glabrata]